MLYFAREVSYFVKFNYRYELQDWLQTDTEKTTFSARDLSNGNSVFVHVLPAVGGAERSSLVELARQKWAESPAELSASIIDVSEYRGAVYIVTAGFSEFTTLREWFAKTSPPRQVQETKQEPGEFSAIFAAYQQQGGGDRTERPVPQPESAVAKEGVGEFTRAFGLATSEPALSSEGPATLNTAEQVAQEPKYSKSERENLGKQGQWKVSEISIETNQPPGGISDQQPGSTLVFDSADSRIVNPTADAANRQGGEQGEFTKFFYTPKTSSLLDHRDDSMNWSSAPATKYSEESTPELPTTEWAPSVRWPDESEAESSDRFVMPGTPPARATSMPDGPGEFTRIIDSPQRRAVPVAQTTTPPQSDISTRVSQPPTQLKLFVILGVLFIIAVAVVLYFALKG